MTTAPVERDQPVEYVNVDVEIGILVQSLMFRHREQQKQLAPVVGVSQSTLSKKLRGSVSFSIAELMRIARHYGVEAGDLLPRLDSNQQPCGYTSAQVNEQVEVYGRSTWDRLYDRCASGLSRAGCDGDSGLAWRDWVNTGWARSAVLTIDETRQLVEQWS